MPRPSIFFFPRRVESGRSKLIF